MYTKQIDITPRELRHPNSPSPLPLRVLFVYLIPPRNPVSGDNAYKMYILLTILGQMISNFIEKQTDVIAQVDYQYIAVYSVQCTVYSVHCTLYTASL